MRTILRAMLHEAGFETVEAADGGEALAALETRPDAALALLDWNMPVMDGFEFLTRVRSNPEFQSLRILMVTTETESDQVTESAPRRSERIPDETIFQRSAFRQIEHD